MAGVFSSLDVSIVSKLLTTFDLKLVLTESVEFLGQELGLDSAIAVSYFEGKNNLFIEWVKDSSSEEHDASLMRVFEVTKNLSKPLASCLAISDTEQISQFEPIRKDLELLRIRALISAPIRHQESDYGSILLTVFDSPRLWTEEERVKVDQFALVLGISIANAISRQEASLNTPLLLKNVVDEEARSFPANDTYQRLVEHSDAIIFHSNIEHKITFISQRSIDFFGIRPEDFLTGNGIAWFELVHLEDREFVEQKLEQAQRDGMSFEEELRVVNYITGRLRWLLVKCIPVMDANNQMTGWDCFGIDVTLRRDAQEALNVQSKKVRALYTVASAIRGFLDPANISSRGLSALCDATGAQAGLCYLFNQKRLRDLTLVAHHGLPIELVEQLRQGKNSPSLSEYVAQNGQPVVVSDMKRDPRAGRLLSQDEFLRSAVLVPITAEEEVLGTIGLFSSEVGRFDGGDVMLASAAANQIGLAARQAHLFTAYRKQTRNLSALYRMSHELSGNLPLQEIFQKAFSILREELGVQRLWLGLLNEPGNRLIGQAAFGPGWRKKLVQMNVELGEFDHPIARVVRSRKPSVLENPSEALKELGVKKIFSRLGIQSVALVPLIASGQLLGVLAVQPESDDEGYNEEELTLLVSLANEMGRAILTRRLEDRIAESDRMRTAGLLAAGIAHNFNNLLQAIVGQAALLDMDKESNERVKKASKRIQEAANRGAGLVRQLTSFAQLDEPHRERTDINEIITQTTERTKQQLPEGFEFRLRLQHDLPETLVDSSHMRRILSSLISNAFEASNGSGVVEIFTDVTIVDRRSPQFDIPFGCYIRIGVRDHGKGMDAETKKRCFEPFFTTRDVDPASGVGITGAGLGLAAAYALARKNGGRIVVDSRPGKGSLFTVYIPTETRELLEEQIFVERSDRKSFPLGESEQILKEETEPFVEPAKDSLDHRRPLEGLLRGKR